MALTTAQPSSPDPSYAPAPESVLGEVRVPPSAVGLVLLAHGTLGRAAKRNRELAGCFHQARLGTGLFGFEEDSSQAGSTTLARVERMARGLLAFAERVRGREDCRHLPPAYAGFGAGAASTLIAATVLPPAPIVLAGGRLHHQGLMLEALRAPVLLITSRGDRDGLASSAAVLDRLPIGSELAFIDGGPDLTEGRSLFEAAHLASEWLARRLRHG